MISSKQFWVLVAGLTAFVAKFLWPSFPLDGATVLLVILFVLGLFGIVPKLTARATAGDLVRSLEFWTMVAALAGFAIHFYVPDFPIDQAAILGLILYVLSLFGINPQVVEEAATFAVRAAEQAYTADGEPDKKSYAIEIALLYLKSRGYLVLTDGALSLVEAAVEEAVFSQFNDPVVHKYID
jgi:hypothetical protein